ncbi:hypothetical protein [Pseudonocardia endophytica]|uniref:hypothetical protein n=1 Tax=Pseudonocardia endophytica TaxID=401976 RepID=UPI0014052BE9|nr:hypothetical protein [Pseudonocardia endophytica]
MLGGAVLLGVVLATLAIVQWAGDTDQAPFEPGSAADVIGAVGRAGLQVCSVRDEPDPLARQATSSSTVRISTDCAAPTPQASPAAAPRRTSDDATAVIDRYATAADRDAVARELTARIRPRGSGVVYTWRDMTVLVRGDADDTVRERLESVLRGSGAV